MSLRHRLGRLEREWAERPCPGCSGNPPVRVLFEDEDGPEPEPCPVCGRQRPVITIRFDVVDRCPHCGHVYAGEDGQPCPKCGRQPYDRAIRLHWPEDGQG